MMLGKVEQESMTLSPYSELFDILIEKDDFWRVLNEMVDFGFIYDEVKEKYSDCMGKMCIRDSHTAEGALRAVS